MKTITANIPARTLKSSSGKTFSYPARTATFTQDDAGQWTNEFGNIREVEVIEVCQKGSNWAAIRREHFPMHGFHN